MKKSTGVDVIIRCETSEVDSTWGMDELLGTTEEVLGTTEEVLGTTEELVESTEELKTPTKEVVNATVGLVCITEELSSGTEDDGATVGVELVGSTTCSSRQEAWERELLAKANGLYPSRARSGATTPSTIKETLKR